MAPAAGAVQSRALTPSLFRIRGGILRRPTIFRKPGENLLNPNILFYLTQFACLT